MARKESTRIWELAPGEIAELDNAQGTLLRVTRGVLWVTMERDTRDIVLAAGDAFVVDRNGVTLVEANGRTTVCVLAPHAGEARCHPKATGWSRLLAAWLRGAYRRANSRRRFVPYL